VIYIAKQQICHKYIYKLHSEKLRNSNWNLWLPLEEAMANGTDIVALSDSQVLRFIDEINNKNTDLIAKGLKYKIKETKLKPYSIANKNKIQRLYTELYETQFQPDYMCVIMDNKADYLRANKGFSVNGIRYKRFLGTNGGIKNSTIVYVSERVYPILKERLDCGRNKEIPLVPAKLEAYQALICSGSIPVSMPKGIIVVPDCETVFHEDIITIDDSNSDEPILEEVKDAEIHLTDSDGYGLMLPSISKQWNKELGMSRDGEYLSGVNTRGLPWTKGMLFTFDFIQFAEEVAGTYEITDIWGHKRDIRDAEVILTGSMLKLWDSYSSFEDYWENVIKYNYQFAFAKTAPHELEGERQTNYQFLQSYDLTDEQIAEFIAPTVDWINDVLGMDYRRSLLYLLGGYLTDRKALSHEPDFVKALMIEPQMINDPFVRNRIRMMINTTINNAKKGVINVKGNFAIIGGDPYALLQSVFGLEITGLLQAGECYHKYWSDQGVPEVVCFRAPMTSHNNIRKLKCVTNDEINKWFRYISTCMLLNAWDTTCDALNGADKDGDLFFTTNNQILMDNTRPTLSIHCVQRKAPKIIPTEQDIVQANLLSFGDEIGATTNTITSQIDIQANFKKDSEEYKVLDYRIKCGQLYQQNAID